MDAQVKPKQTPKTDPDKDPGQHPIPVPFPLPTDEPTKEKQDKCQVCTNRKVPLSEATCKQLQTLLTKTQHRAGVEKLCQKIEDDTMLQLVAQKLNEYPAEVATIFLTDITPVACGGKNYLCENVDLLNANLVQAWKAEYDALKPAGEKPRNDFETLQVILKMQTTEQTQVEHLFEIVNASGTGETITGTPQEKLQVFLKRYSIADCQTCGNGATYGIPTLAIVWLNAQYMIGLYDAGLTDAYNLLSTNTFLHPSTGNWGFVAKSGVNHMISDIRTRSLTLADIEHLDQGLSGSTKRYDLKRQGNKGYIEYKSYTENYGLNDLTGIGSGSWKDFDQFIAYLSQPEVVDMQGGSLEYVFDKKKIPNVNDIKSQFRTMMVDDSNPNNLQLKPQGVTVFNTIWGNNGLRASLFPRTDYDPNYSEIQYKDAALLDFIEIVSDVNNNFYKFINVK
ncbi:hypothetical protein [Xanthocytophaga flava]|uniref:hypothetical protein n=1 Tax=Xanthocytophaga flava TaxID=3048013 RepID=UPI0028D183B6|nr:hypothetical protein [Xanthocytophaga flavus]MDJ1472541.1 hypothetical protein [Xanthocytophaga flavus]